MSSEQGATTRPEAPPDDSANATVEVTSGAPASATCDDPLPVMEAGEVIDEVCPTDLSARQLTVVDLSEDWVPRVFARPDGVDSRQPYREILLALAQERLDDLPRRVRRERFLELFGIFPTPEVVAARLLDQERHACHRAVEDEVLSEVERTVRPWGLEVGAQRRRVNQVRYLRNRLERARERRGLDSFEDLASDPEMGRVLTQFEEKRVPVEAIRAAQGHLQCDGLLRARRRGDGVYDWQTVGALREWQRMHMVVGAGLLDAPTRDALQRDSQEEDFRTLLRLLRERVVSATGLIEDGSASHQWGTVFGRQLDPPQVVSAVGQPPAFEAAPDHISPATEAAARSLGWTSPSEASSQLQTPPPPRVAVRLPSLPTYHSEHMELRAEIDRGDLWFTLPYDPETGQPRGHRVSRRPVVTLYAQTEEGDIALVRWATTVGGWKPEIDEEGVVGLRYKESPPGPRIWRDVIASPAWLPPAGTPDSDLLRHGRPNHDILGPGYRSAYGLTMVMHHKVVPREEGEEPLFADEGIRVHGSVSYRSIGRGTSHGCHRLFNHLAVRLSSFLLAHRRHAIEGALPASWQRTVTHEESSHTLRVRSRGYRFELTPPVPVDVLEGRIRGPVRRAPAGFFRLPEEIAAEVAALEADE